MAISTVLSIKGLPVLGSVSFGKSSKTCVISFPLSPQPIYTIISASHHFANWCCNIVFPVPNPPGIVAVPPLLIGKIESITLCPVNKGIFACNLSLYGLCFLTAHFCTIVISIILPSSVFTLAITSVIE